MAQYPSFAPYINFPGNAAEVLEHWHELFGGDLDLMSYDAMDTSGFPFTPPEGAVAHAHLHGGLVNIAGGDAIGQASPAPLDCGVHSFILQPATVDAGRELIERIASAGGEVAMPFEQAPWGAHYGQAKDRFGVLWQINVEAAPVQAGPED